MSKLKEYFKKLIYGYKYNSDTYIKHLRSIGMKVGKNVTIYSPKNVLIDETRPFLIEIGDNVEITNGVTILTHGYDWSVLKQLTGEVLGSSGKVIIGNNVFIGMNSTILKGVTVGDNVIIGAGSLVNKNLKSDMVYAGNPVHEIMSVSDYLIKRRDLQFKEAKELAQAYYDRFNCIPPKIIFREFFGLFELEKDITKIDSEFIEVLNLGGNGSKSFEVYQNHTPIFKGYEEFIKEIDLESRN